MFYCMFYFTCDRYLRPTDCHCDLGHRTRHVYKSAATWRKLKRFARWTHQLYLRRLTRQTLTSRGGGPSRSLRVLIFKQYTHCAQICFMLTL